MSEKKNVIWIIVAAVVLLVLCCLVVGVFGFVAYQRSISNVTEALKTVEVATAVVVEKAPASPTQAPPTAAPTVSAPPTQPAAAPGVPFTYEKLSLVYAPSLAKGMRGEVVPAAPADSAPWDQAPEHFMITLDDYSLPSTFHQPQINIYPVKAYAAKDESAAKVISDLQALIKTQPKLDAHAKDALPFLPIWNAAQIIHTNLAYVKFANGSGVRYLSYYAQDVSPINNNGLFYTFQGLTSDGQYYVSVLLPVNNSAVLPATGELSGDDYQKFADNFEKYLNETITQLDAQPAGGFSPSLDVLDNLVKSIQVK